MSAPDTNIEKQTRRHKPPLVGIALAVIVAGLLLFGFLSTLSDKAEPPTQPTVADQ